MELIKDRICCMERVENYSLFTEKKIEIEYIVADRNTFEVLPYAEKLIEKASGENSRIYSPIEENIIWSSLETPHIIKFETCKTDMTFQEAEKALYNQLICANRLLEEYNAVLISPSVLLLNNNENLCSEQSCILHLHLPFKNENELVRLQTAATLLIPLIPALSYSIPLTGNFDMRSQIGIKADYESASVDIKIINIQESLHADLAIARFITYVLELLVNCPAEIHDCVDTAELSSLLDEVIEKGMKTFVFNKVYLEMLGIKNQEKMSAWGIWMLLAKQVKEYSGLKIPSVENILKTGSLSERIMTYTEKESKTETCRELVSCLKDNRMMLL